MRIQLFFAAALMLSALFFAVSCKKTSSSPGSPTNHDSSGTSSKYIVDTYVKPSSRLEGPGKMCVDENGFLYVAQVSDFNLIKVDPLVQSIGNFVGMTGTPGC